ncbi:MAG: type II toxin-antitoxin system VapC family toxin [Calothrix sp. SM1_7_51]|nr:type II toxin-antitoxin system VapC family toxin [Calothrix sp. SM1_7_51]
MSRNIVLLDSGPLSWVINLRSKKPDVIRCSAWFRRILNNYTVMIPEIADYEVRRELIHQKLEASLKRLDELKDLNDVVYQPITTEIMNKSANLWGWARSTGQSTAQSTALDGDVIVAATAIITAQTSENQVIIATTNVKDLQRYYTNTYHWHDDYWAI